MTTGKRRATARLGRAASARLRTKMVALLVETPDITAADAAVELRVSRQRAQAYMTAEVKAEAAKLREDMQADKGLEAALEDVDRAMVKQARMGNVQAARLVYMRVAQKGGEVVIPTLEELEAELLDLKRQQTKDETNDGTDRDAFVAMADEVGG